MPKRVWPGWEKDLTPTGLAAELVLYLRDHQAGRYCRWRLAPYRVVIVYRVAGQPETYQIDLKEWVRRTCFRATGRPFEPGKVSSFGQYSFNGGNSCLKALVPHLEAVRARLPAWSIDHKIVKMTQAIDQGGLLAILAASHPHLPLYQERSLATPVKVLCSSDPWLQSWYQRLGLDQDNVRFRGRRTPWDGVLCFSAQPAGFIRADPAVVALLIEVDDGKHFGPPRLAMLPEYALHSNGSAIWLPPGLALWKKLAAQYRAGGYMETENGVCDGGDVKCPYYDAVKDWTAAQHGLRMIRVPDSFAERDPVGLHDLIVSALTGSVPAHPRLLMAVNLKVI